MAPPAPMIGTAEFRMVRSEPSKPWIRISSFREISPSRMARAPAHSSGAIGRPLSSHQPLNWSNPSMPM